MSIGHWPRAASGDINFYHPSPKRKEESVSGGRRMRLAHPGMVNAASASSEVSKLFLKGPKSAYFRFLSRVFSVTTGQLCRGSSTTDNEQAKGTGFVPM